MVCVQMGGSADAKADGKTKGIECYHCNSHIEAEKDCDTVPVPEKYLVDCGNTALNQTQEYLSHHASHLTKSTLSFCRKAFNEFNGKTWVVRSCGSQKDEKDRGCYSTSSIDVKSVVCQCFDSKCNSVSNLRLSLVLLPVVAALAVWKL